MALFNDADPIMIGLADVTFDGIAAPLLGDAVTLSIQPSFIDVPSFEFGPNSRATRIQSGWDVRVAMAFDVETFEAYKLALPLVEKTDSVTPAKKALFDSPVGTNLRAQAKEIVIHPRSAGASVHTYDVTIFAGIAEGNVQRSYGFEKSVIRVEFVALIKDGADSSKEGNYFRIGPVLTP